MVRETVASNQDAGTLVQPVRGAQLHGEPLRLFFDRPMLSYGEASKKSKKRAVHTLIEDDRVD